MPLTRARCNGCHEPLGDPPGSPVVARCVRCGSDVTVPILGDGQPAFFDASTGAMDFLHWLAAAKAAMTSGRLGVAVGRCGSCRAALQIAFDAPVSLKCPHCAETRTGRAVDLLVDQWTEPWVAFSDGATNAEYRVECLRDADGTAAGCAGCDMPTPPNDPSARCVRCGAVTWLPADGGARVQMGVRGSGEQHGRPYRVVLSLAAAERVVPREGGRIAAMASGGRAMSMTALGCAITTFLVALFVGVVVIAVRLFK